MKILQRPKILPGSRGYSAAYARFFQKVLGRAALARPIQSKAISMLVCRLGGLFTGKPPFSVFTVAAAAWGGGLF